jgi:rRNA maturation endonuclease Nob1
MIHVSLNVLIFSLPLGDPRLDLWRVAIFLNGVRQRRERRAFRHVLRCGLCAFEFEDTTSTLLPRCPRCGSLNERYRLSRL